MAWIELHQGLAQHHKVRRLKRLLGVGTAQAVGHLALIWTWALGAAPEGDLSRFDYIDIAEQAEWDGEPSVLVDALVSAGLLDDEGERLVIHDWLDYAGKLLERKQANAKRMREARAMHVRNTCDARAEMCGATIPNLTIPNQEIVRSDETHLSVKSSFEPTTDAPQRLLAKKPRHEYTAEFEAFWQAYPPRRRVDKFEAFGLWKRALASGATADEIMAGLSRWKNSREWAKDNGDFVCMPSVFLSMQKRRWESQPEQAKTGQDVPSLKQIPPEVVGKPWLEAWLQHGGHGTGAASVMNFAAAVGVDPLAAAGRFKDNGLAAAGDYVWEARAV